MAERLWLVRMENSDPLGPLPEEKILRGLVAGKVPLEAQVQPQGSDTWLPIRTTAPFATTAFLLSGQGAPITLPRTLGRSLVEETGALPASPSPPAHLGRWWLVACSVFFLLVTGVAAVICKQQTTRTAEGTTRELLARFSTGDVAPLRDREDLGQSAKIRLEIQQRGGHELERRHALLARAEAIGHEKFKDMAVRVRRAGDIELRRLPPEEQRRIREASQLRYVVEHGFLSLPAEEQELAKSADDLLELARRPALFRRLGEKQLTGEERQQLASIGGPDSPADPAVQRLLSRTMVVGEQAFLHLWRRVINHGKESWDALSGEETLRISQRSLQDYLYTHGFGVLTKEERAYIGRPQDFFENEATVAKIKRKLGLDTLPANDRADAEDLPGDTKEASQLFIEKHGTSLLSEALRTAFTAGGYSLDAVEYRGRVTHSLLRSSSAQATFQFKSDEVPARRWLPGHIFLEYERGHYQVVSKKIEAETPITQLKKIETLLQGEPTDPAEKKSAKEFVATLTRHISGGIVGADLLVLALLTSSFWLLVRKRNEGLVTREEGVAAAMALGVAAVQHLAQGQVSMDDWAATPVYLSIPCLVGARRGPLSGYVAGALVGLALLSGTTLFQPPTSSSVFLDMIPVGDFALAVLVLGALGVIAGLVGQQPLAVALLPLLWIPGSALLQREILWSTSLYGRCTLAVVLTSLALALRTTTTTTPSEALLTRLFQVNQDVLTGSTERARGLSSENSSADSALALGLEPALDGLGHRVADAVALANAQ